MKTSRKIRNVMREYGCTHCKTRKNIGERTVNTKISVDEDSPLIQELHRLLGGEGAPYEIRLGKFMPMIGARALIVSFEHEIEGDK